MKPFKAHPQNQVRIPFQKISFFKHAKYYFIIIARIGVLVGEPRGKLTIGPRSKISTKIQKIHERQKDEKVKGERFPDNVYWAITTQLGR